MSEMVEVRKPARRRSWAWGAAGILLFAIAAAVLLNAKARLETAAAQDLAAALAELKKDGFATTLEELAPPPVPDEKNAGPLLLTAMSLFDRLPRHDAVYAARRAGFASLTTEGKIAARRHLEEHREAFAALSGSGLLPHCRVKKNYALRDEDPFVFPLLGVKECSNFLALRAEVALADGKPEEAFESIRAAFAVSDRIAQEPFFFADTFASVHRGIFLESFGRWVATDTPGDVMRRLREMLPTAESFRGKGERAMRCHLAEIAKSSLDPTHVREMASLWLRGLKVHQKPFSSSLLKRDVVRLLSFFRRLAPIMQHSYPIAFEEIRKLRDEMKSDRPERNYSSSLSQSMSNGWRNSFLTAGRVAVLRAGLECEIARKEKGTYPDSVSEIDPFTEKPLLYDSAKGLLYSVGPNMRDDGGAMDSDDIVWRLRRVPDAK